MHKGIPAALSGLLAMALILFTVFPAAVPAAAATSIHLSRTNVAAGDSVDVTGYGFRAGETAVVSMNYSSGGTNHRVQVAVTVASNGDFVAKLTIPAAIAPATYSVTAHDFHGDQATTPIHVLPLVTLKAGSTAAVTSIPAGHAFYVRGSGFPAGQKVTLSVTFPRYGESAVTQTQTVVAGTQGTFGDTTFAIPARAMIGTFTLTGVSSKATGKAPIHVIYVPHVSLAHATVAPGGTAAITGSGFVSNARIAVSITFKRNNLPNETLTQVVTTDGKGNFSLAFQTPASASPASDLVTARDTVSGATATTHLTVAVRLAIALVQNNVRPGTIVHVTGSGFSASTDVTLTAHFPLYGGGSRTVTAVTRSSDTGRISTQFQVPFHAAAGTVTVAAKAPNGQVTAALHVVHVAVSLTVTPSVIPGSAVTVHGAGYGPNQSVTVRITVRVSGATKILTASTTTDANGAFTTSIHVPGAAAGGTYTVQAVDNATGRVASAHFTVATLKPAVVAVPTTGAPGTAITINGFGFAAGQRVTLSLGGHTLITVTTNGAGQFKAQTAIPHGLATGPATITASSTSGQTAHIAFNVQRTIATHFYFASEYTGNGYHEYLAFLNPSRIQARATITYQKTVGAPVTKTITVPAHSRTTEDVNADLGTHVSAAAAIAADVPIAVERLVYHGVDGAVVPGTHSPATVWYFVNGNTSHSYREFVAIQNPNTTAIQVAVHFLPTHHRAFTIYRNMAPQSRTTVKVNSYVHKDAVGVVVTSRSPIIANQTMFTLHGMTSKIGVNAPQRTWYFASGPIENGAKNWIGVINPTGARTYLTLRAYNRSGVEIGAYHHWLTPYARVGLLVNRIAHSGGASVVLAATRGIVAEQMTYAGRMHNESTDTFGAPSPAKAWMFAAVNTTNGASDTLALFNPSLLPEPIVVQFITASGHVSQRTYVVAPLSHQTIYVASVEPNQQLGIVAASSQPFVALNQGRFNGDRGSDSSIGING